MDDFQLNCFFFIFFLSFSSLLLLDRSESESDLESAASARHGVQAVVATEATDSHLRRPRQVRKEREERMEANQSRLSLFSLSLSPSSSSADLSTGLRGEGKKRRTEKKLLDLPWLLGKTNSIPECFERFPLSHTHTLSPSRCLTRESEGGRRFSPSFA